MKKQKLEGYLVLELNHSGKPDSEIKPETFTEHQRAVMACLEPMHQEAIWKGYPIIVSDTATGERIEAFNLCNVSLNKIQEQLFFRRLLDEVIKFKNDPANAEKIEEWKRKHEQEKKKKD